MLNKIVIQGRLTGDPELRHTQTGKAVASFSVACEQDYKGSDGKRATDFFNAVAWGKAGEFVNEYFQKGDMIIISGRLTNRSWTDKGGNKRTTAEIVVEGSYFGGGAKRDSRATHEPVTDNYEEIYEQDEDLPF